MTRTHGARVVAAAAAAGPDACVRGINERPVAPRGGIELYCVYKLPVFYACGTYGGRVANRAESIVSGGGGGGKARALKDWCVCVCVYVSRRCN